MIDIIFKNVGQGDSIIIEWERDLSNKIGIIDCNLYEGRNPVLDHVISFGFKEIEFIILSHPHYDHFSGIRSLLEYCAINKITINGRIEFTTYISDEVKDINLNEDLGLKFLAPSSVEYENFLNQTPLFDQEDSHNNAQANWLSTIIKVFSKDWYILLTSDSTVQTLKRVGIQKKIEFSSNLKLGQSPHHGARNNHYDGFWKTKNHDKKTPIVFSVGPNIYNHPSPETVAFFSEAKHNYQIFSTNQVGSLNKFSSNLQSDIISAYLDLSGSIQHIAKPGRNKYNGEQLFSFR